MTWARLEEILLRVFSLAFWLALAGLAYLLADRYLGAAGMVLAGLLALAGLYAAFGRSPLARKLRWPAYAVALILKLVS